MEIIVEGSSFLWHQIRCIVAILILIGQQKETPSLIDELLDIEKYPSKPQYTMASELPLCLYDCQYPPDLVKWRFDPPELAKCIKHLQDKWLESETRASIVKGMLDSLESQLAHEQVSVPKWGQRGLEQPYASLQGKSQAHSYVRFQDRDRAGSLEQRVEHYVKKRRLDADVYEKINESNELAKSLNVYKPNS